MWLMDDDDFAKLQHVNKRLFGDGSILTPDQRRDLANLMHLLLGRALHQKDKDGLE